MLKWLFPTAIAWNLSSNASEKAYSSLIKTNLLVASAKVLQTCFVKPRIVKRDDSINIVRLRFGMVYRRSVLLSQLILSDIAICACGCPVFCGWLLLIHKTPCSSIRKLQAMENMMTGDNYKMHSNIQ